MSELKHIHALSLTLGLTQQSQFASKILSFSALSDLGNVDYSFRILSQLSNPTTFHWNTVIRGYSKSPNPNCSVSAFVQMSRRGIKADRFTCLFLTKASALSRRKELGETIHGLVVKHGFDSDIFNQNTLIHMYACCGEIDSSRKVFDEMPERNFVSWTAMLDGYAKSDDMGSARKVFELMPERDVVAWSSLIDGYVKAGECSEALNLFERMRAVGVRANEVTVVSVLRACAHLCELERGRSMHRYVVENGLAPTLVLRTALVDMYAKCGAVEAALEVFREGLSQKTDVFIWNAMIGGLARHGLVKESLDLFEEMEASRIVPDEITYLCLLNACAHGGLVKEAWHFFGCLNKHGLMPKSEHYACIVDVLARAGQVAEALQFLRESAVEPTAEMLGALLSGCVNHGELDLAEMIGKKLIEIEPEHGGRYVGLSNAYAIYGRWDDARNAREAMDRRGVRKTPGLSLV